MVVIKSKPETLKSKFSDGDIRYLEAFSHVIGYSIEYDNEIKIEFNPDRPDLFSFPSLIRAIKSYYDRDFVLRSLLEKDNTDIYIEKEALYIRPYFYSFSAIGSQIGKFLPDLIDFQEKIHEVVGKNRSKVSIGIHDLENINPPFHYKVACTDLIFETYDGFRGKVSEILKKHSKGIEFSHLLGNNDKVTLITDSNDDVLSMPPIINGSKSKLSENTKKFFIDLTGTDSKSVIDAFYLLKNFFESLNYRIYLNRINGIADNFEDKLLAHNWRKIRISRSEVKKISGSEMNIEDMIISLRRMGYVAEPSENGIIVYVPGQRVDVMGPVDVVEDIIKAVGLENIQEQELPIGLSGVPSKNADFLEHSRDVMIGLGYQEVMSFVLSERIYEDEYSGGVKLENPKSDDFSVIRDRLFPNLIMLLKSNKNRPLPQKIFEIGETIENAVQHTKLCAMLSNNRATYSDIRGILDSYIQ
ncbi:MAG: phenylalanine--tRNA ligase subunit beta, partial [Thermoplasmata archaeon]